MTDEQMKAAVELKAWAEWLIGKRPSAVGYEHDLSTHEVRDRVELLLTRLAAADAVVQAAREWRVGRDRNIVGTAPSGGQRSATGVALIDALDALDAAEREGK